MFSTISCIIDLHRISNLIFQLRSYMVMHKLVSNQLRINERIRIYLNWSWPDWLTTQSDLTSPTRLCPCMDCRIVNRLVYRSRSKLASYISKLSLHIRLYLYLHSTNRGIMAASECIKNRILSKAKCTLILPSICILQSIFIIILW